MPNDALIFGYNDYTFEIKKNIESYYKNIHILELATDTENSFDLSDNWDELSQKYDIKNCVAFCILEAGMDEYLTKPVDKNKLANIISKVL